MLHLFLIFSVHFTNGFFQLLLHQIIWREPSLVHRRRLATGGNVLHDNYHSTVSYCATASGPQHNSHVRPLVCHLALTRRPAARGDRQNESEIARGDTKNDGLEMIFMICGSWCCCCCCCCYSDAAVQLVVQPVFERAVQLQLIHSDINRLISGQRYNQSSFRFLSLHRALRCVGYFPSFRVPAERLTTVRVRVVFIRKFIRQRLAGCCQGLGGWRRVRDWPSKVRSSIRKAHIHIDENQ